MNLIDRLVSHFLRIVFGLVKALLSLTRGAGRPSGEKVAGAWKSILAGEPVFAIDVGGAVELQPHWEKLDGVANFLIFEPHPQSAEDIRAKYAARDHAAMYHVFTSALSGASGERDFYLTNQPTGSSLCPINNNSRFVSAGNEYFFPLRQMKVKTISLKDWAKENPRLHTHLLKLDVQGAELEILRGMSDEQAAELAAIELEIPNNDFYRGGAELGGVVEFLRDKGFEPFDFRVARSYTSDVLPVEGREDLLSDPWDPSIAARAWELEIVAFKNPLVWLESRDIASLRRLLLAYCTYNFYIDAAWLIEEMGRRRLLAEEEVSKLRGAIVCLKADISSSLRFAGILYKANASRNWAQYIWMTYPTT